MKWVGINMLSYQKLSHFFGRFFLRLGCKKSAKRRKSFLQVAYASAHPVPIPIPIRTSHSQAMWPKSAAKRKCQCNGTCTSAAYFHNFACRSWFGFGYWICVSIVPERSTCWRWHKMETNGGFSSFPSFLISSCPSVCLANFRWW